MKQQRKPPNKTVLIVLSGIAGVLVLVLCVGIIGALVSGDEEQPAATVPAYKVVSEDGREIVVEVDALPDGDGLKAIFDQVRTKDRPDGGYSVRINCSTGGTAAADNRLANGRFGIGNLGEAQTGLKNGEVTFDVNEGRTCPA